MSVGPTVLFATGSDGQLYPVLSAGSGGSPNYAKNTPFALSSSASVTLTYAVNIGSTTPPAQMALVGGKTNDGTPQYQPLPEGPGGRTVIVEGFAGGVAVPVTFSGTSSVNVAQVAGNTTSVNNGVTDVGTQRVTISSDSTGQVKLAAGSAVIGHVITDSGSTTAVTSLPSIPAGSNVIGALTADQTINVDQVAGAATAAGNGVTTTGTQRVTISSDSTGQVKLATGANVIGALTADQTVNIDQVGGSTTSTNAGNRSAGTQRVLLAGNGTGTVTQVASSASDTSLLAANTNRTGTLFFNDSTAIMYLLYGTGVASTTNYSVQVPSKGYYEDPFHYTGGYHAIWASANGFVYCTEVS